MCIHTLRMGPKTILGVYENKSVVIMAIAAVGNRCHVHLLDKYLSKLHPKSQQLDCFYTQPLGVNAVSDPAKNWISAQPCYRIWLKMVGIEGKNNYSLRATGATEIFRAGVPEKIIQKRTGHRCLKALQTYERTTAAQRLSVANILYSSSVVTFSDAKGKLPSVNSTCGIPGFANMIGTASHCESGWTFCGKY